MTDENEKTRLQQVATMLAQPGVAEKIEALLKTPATPESRLESAIKMAADIEALKREVAELHNKLIVADNRVKNAEDQERVRGVNVITELLIAISEAPHKTTRMLEAVERANAALLRAGSGT